MAGETAVEKVEDTFKALADTLTGSGQSLEGWATEVDRSRDDAIDPDTNTLVISTTALSMRQFEELNQTEVTQVVEFEFISGGAAPGTLRRTNLRAAAAYHAAIAADRTLGGMLQDVQETDIVPADIGGADVNGVSVQYQVTYFIAQDDWLTIYGHGATF